MGSIGLIEPTSFLGTTSKYLLDALADIHASN